ncbi:N-acetylglucosamine-6-phosphate deacetylase [Oceanisphaera profunda]|uniref:N-acetylglucosamine-6-phosphate deacetylase n=1 Tax=Oceanisphaera profunda TaxID=1416627 RepID=A0A1Y0D2Q9_9GAMM|nr:N-acetylglucosamine-6-phosphate deacetylase [Oceanisphaera profunda]ART81496.1 N-acetylglucosamine-6-phosphate deacetylase [Oceanisphaera profunda]
MFALTACRIFTGECWLDQHAVIISNGRIQALVPEAELGEGIVKYPQAGAIVCAGFIDLQLNGCGGVMFNSDISTATLAHMQRTNLTSGTTSYLPTLITSPDADIRAALSVTREYMRAHAHQVLGLHLEGPYLNVVRKGIHPAAQVRALDADMLDFLCQQADVLTKITLAPECHSPLHIHQLVAAGIKVAIGHTAASFEQARAGFAAGISFATHLYNAMTPTANGRTPGVVGAIYDNDSIYAGIIADGFHVHEANIRLAHNVLGQRLCLVTDATAAAGAPASLTEFDFCGTTVRIKDGQCLDEQGTLGGSALTMIEGVRYLVNTVGLSLDDALRMASLNPAKAIGCEQDLGAIAVGKVANLVILSEQLLVLNTVVNGQLTH